MKSTALEVFNILKTKKGTQFYRLSGHQVGKLALDFPCEDDKCNGCDLCQDDRNEFSYEYNKLTKQFKDDVLNTFKNTISNGIKV
jgi:hypothetical protein